MTCGRCHRPERIEYLLPAYDPDAPSEAVPTCRRCRLPVDARGLWDKMQAAEMAVMMYPDDRGAITQLRAARVDFDLAVRGTAKRSRKARA